MQGEQQGSHIVQDEQPPPNGLSEDMICFVRQCRAFIFELAPANDPLIREPKLGLQQGSQHETSHGEGHDEQLVKHMR